MEWGFWLVLLVMVAIAFLSAAFLVLRPPTLSGRHGSRGGKAPDEP